MPRFCLDPLCFNPRAREGRDPELSLALDAEAVSIHAPVKGATPAQTHLVELVTQFQSTRP